MQNFISFIQQNSNIIVLLLLFLFILLGGWIIYIQISLKKIIKRNKELFKGSEGENLETILNNHIKRVNFVLKNLKKLDRICEEIDKMASSSVQKIGIIRFNPFSDVGGNQSFAIALLDSRNSGFVFSSLHSREGTRVYAKPIISEKSEYHLSTEEIKAIKKAINIKNNKKENKGL